jgi:hypothetical protein
MIRYSHTTACLADGADAPTRLIYQLVPFGGDDEQAVAPRADRPGGLRRTHLELRKLGDCSDEFMSEVVHARVAASALAGTMRGTEEGNRQGRARAPARSDLRAQRQTRLQPSSPTIDAVARYELQRARHSFPATSVASSRRTRFTFQVLQEHTSVNYSVMRSCIPGLASGLTTCG